MKSPTYGFNNADTVLVGSFGMLCFVLVGTVQTLVRALRDPAYGDFPGFALAMLWLLTSTVYLAAKFTQRNNLSQVILNCGPNPHRSYYFGCAIFLAFFSLAGGFVFDMQKHWNGVAAYWQLAAMYVICSALAAYYLHLGMGRLLVVKAGIWHYWGLLKWQSITAWKFSQENPHHLILHSNSWLPFLRVGVLAIPDESRGTLEAILTENVGISAQRSPRLVAIAKSP